MQGQELLCGKVSKSDSLLDGRDIRIEIPDLHLSVYCDSAGHFCLKVPKQTFVNLHVTAPEHQSKFTVVSLPQKQNLALKLVGSGLNLDEIVIYGQMETPASLTSNSIDHVSIQAIHEKGALTLSEGITVLPGVTELKTGPGISKPVVRGLYGNRIQTILFGTRFDNQQWQDEHGLGLSTSGISEVEVIKGPATLFYGSEAMGGVINILPEKNAANDKTEIDVHSRFFSNTYGAALEAGIRQSHNRKAWGVRLSNESHADYTDGQGFRILNSRFGGTTGKAFFQYTREKWQSRNTYYLSHANYGFLMDAYQLYGFADERLSRSFSRPHHTVLLNLLSSENLFFFKDSRFTVNISSFFNSRQEQEGAAGISLYMLLNSYSALLSWQKKLSASTEIVLSSQNQFQTNRNAGSRTIVPDANTRENSLSAFLKHQKKQYIVEGGLRIDQRDLQTFATGNLNAGNPFDPGRAILPTKKTFNSLNGAIGSSFRPFSFLNCKANLSSGYRSPNLAEFSSNGLHEGSLRYEVGSTTLKTEQNLCGDFSFRVEFSAWSLWCNAYYNRFKNYIYLEGSNEEYLGFQIYRFQQKDALLKGFETGLSYQKKQLKISTQLTGVSGKTNQGENLPFIPATRTKTEVQWQEKQVGKLRALYVFLNYHYVFSQENFGQFETRTDAYSLLGAGLGGNFILNRQTLEIKISANNLLNTYYVDHLSRLKYYGIHDQGRSINLHLIYRLSK